MIRNNQNKGNRETKKNRPMVHTITPANVVWKQAQRHRRHATETISVIETEIHPRGVARLGLRP